jgi:hypothetical protein
MIDLSNVTAIALGADEVLEIQDSLGTVLWQKNINYNVTITNTDNYTGATYQIDNGTVEPINETGTTSFIISPSATTLTVNRNGKGVTEINGVEDMTSVSDWVAVIPVNKMSTNVSIDLISIM